MMGDNIGLLPSIGQPQRVLLARVWPLASRGFPVMECALCSALRGAKNSGMRPTVITAAGERIPETWGL